MLEKGRVPGYILVAGSVGPYGTSRQNGSEYTGDYWQRMTHEELVSWPRDRVKALAEGKVSFIAIETMPHSREALAVMDCVLQVVVVYLCVLYYRNRSKCSIIVFN